MTNHEHNSAHVAAETPAELRGVEAALEDLARAERAVASPGFEDRLQLLSAGRLREAEPPVFVFRRAWLALAACLGVLISGWAVWSASRPGNPPATPGHGNPAQLVAALSSDLDAWLAEADDPIGASLDALFAQTSLLGQTLDSEWLSTDDLNAEDI